MSGVYPTPPRPELERSIREVLNILVAAHRRMDERGYLPSPRVWDPIDGRPAA